jgi:hypothetical protein
MILPAENRPIPFAVLYSGVGEYMGDEHTEEKKLLQRQLESLKGVLTGKYADKPYELKKILRTMFTMLATFLTCNYIFQWHVIRDHGFKAVRYDDFLNQAIGAIGASICLWLIGRNQEITTLGIGELTAKKLR